VNEQYWRPLARAVVDHVHPVRVRNVAITHALDDTELPTISLGQMSASRSTRSHRGETSGTWHELTPGRRAVDRAYQMDQDRGFQQSARPPQGCGEPRRGPDDRPRLPARSGTTQPRGVVL